MNRTSTWRILGCLLLAAFFGIWEALSRLGLIDVNYFPPVTEIIKTLARLVWSLELPGHLVVSLKRVLLGFAAGSAVGWLIGFWCGRQRRVYQVLELTVEFLRPMPSVALIPIGILFLGLGDALNVAVIGWACSWPVFVNTMNGVAAVDRVFIDTARTLGFGRAKILYKVLIPASAPQVFTGLRVGLGIAAAVVVITEMVASSSGLGFFIINTSISYRVAEMYAGIITIGFFGYFLNRLFLLVEKSALSWRRGLEHV